jgi:branched-chain amino acid transport system permease protein
MKAEEEAHAVDEVGEAAGPAKRAINATKAGGIAAYALLFVVICVLPQILPEYLQSLITSMFIFGLFAMSLNLLLGYTGLFSLGHAAFFGMGAYMAGIMSVRVGIHNFWLLAIIGTIAATVLAAIFGLLALRVSAFRFLMVTFALGELLFAVAYNWHRVFGGAFGLSGYTEASIGIPGFHWSPTSLYYFTFAFFAICFALFFLIVKSPFGHTLLGIRANEDRMKALGYNTWRYKYLAFVIAGLFAGFAGVLFIQYHMMVTPSHFGVTTSTAAILYVIIGGAGTLAGPFIGAVILVALEYYISIYIPDRWPMILGFIFVFAVMFLRGGVGPSVARGVNRLRGK